MRTFLALAPFTFVDSVAAADVRAMSTDRPDQTEGAYTVPKGMYQFEFGLFNYARRLDTDNRSETFTWGEVNAKYGLTHDIDLQLIWQPYIQQRDRGNPADPGFYREGVADRQVNAEDMNAQCAAHNSLQVIATGCLALVADDSDKYLPWLKAQRADGKLVVVDANLRPPHNAVAIAQVAGLSMPVHRGAARPLVNEPIDAAYVHGPTGLGAVTIPPVTRTVDSDDAVTFILDMARSVDGLHLVPIGPLTNIAQALETDPSLPSLLSGITIMGGAAVGGNVTATAARWCGCCSTIGKPTS